MHSNTRDIELELDKQKIEELLTKSALSHLCAKQEQVPHGYFETFDTQVLNKIKSQKRQNPIIRLSTYMPYLMAAAITILIATTFIFIQTDNKTNTIAKVNMQDIPTEEIDSYVSENESIAEIDWQSEINLIGGSLDKETGDNLLQDTNTKQN